MTAQQTTIKLPPTHILTECVIREKDFPLLEDPRISRRLTISPFYEGDCIIGLAISVDNVIVAGFLSPIAVDVFREQLELPECEPLQKEITRSIINNPCPKFLSPRILGKHSPAFLKNLSIYLSPIVNRPEKLIDALNFLYSLPANMSDDELIARIVIQYSNRDTSLDRSPTIFSP